MNNESVNRKNSAAPTILYASRICPFSQRALLALIESNIKFDYVDIEFMAKPQWFVNITPFGKVPVLIDRGETIVESLAIVEYVNEEKNLGWLGETSQKKAFVRAWMLYCDKLHDMTRNFFIAKDEKKIEENIFVLQDALNKCGQYLHIDHFYSEARGDSGLSALGIVYAPLFILLNCLEEKAGHRLISHNGFIQTTAKQLLSHPSIAMLNNDFYKKELLEFMERINPTLFRQEAVL